MRPHVLNAVFFTGGLLMTSALNAAETPTTASLPAVFLHEKKFDVNIQVPLVRDFVAELRRNSMIREAGKEAASTSKPLIIVYEGEEQGLQPVVKASSEKKGAAFVISGAPPAPRKINPIFQKQQTLDAIVKAAFTDSDVVADVNYAKHILRFQDVNLASDETWPLNRPLAEADNRLLTFAEVEALLRKSYGFDYPKLNNQIPSLCRKCGNTVAWETKKDATVRDLVDAVFKVTAMSRIQSGKHGSIITFQVLPVGRTEAGQYKWSVLSF